MRQIAYLRTNISNLGRERFEIAGLGRRWQCDWFRGTFAHGRAYPRCLWRRLSVGTLSVNVLGSFWLGVLTTERIQRQRASGLWLVRGFSCHLTVCALCRAGALEGAVFLALNRHS
jgi:hypothetical protein